MVKGFTNPPPPLPTPPLFHETNLVTARAVENQTTDSISTQMTEYFEVYQLSPKVVVADQQFMSVELEAYHARNGIKPVGIGPDTPWPNRAEAAVRLTKHQIKLMLDGLIKGFGAASLLKMSPTIAWPDKRA